MIEKYLISIVGPTGIGKTALSVELAKHYRTEIISSDSRQFYREMKIGTAVPSNKELSSAPHHFIQCRSIFEDYNVGDFEKDCLQLLPKLFLKHDLLVMVGGSGLYVDTVLKGLDHFPSVDPEIRVSLNKEADTEGLKPLQARLNELDPISYQKIDIYNRQRLIRALEICLGTGLPYSHYLKGGQKMRDFKPVKIGIRAERSIVYDRINLRVDQMIAGGLVEEAEKLFKYRSLNALQTVGYKELFSFFEGNCSLEEAIDEIKKNSRRFAKRQGTWFRKDEEIKWFEFPVNTEKVINYLDQRINP